MPVLTPAASATDRIVAPAKPSREITAAAARQICSRRIGPIPTFGIASLPPRIVAAAIVAGRPIDLQIPTIGRSDTAARGSRRALRGTQGRSPPDEPEPARSDRTPPARTPPPPAPHCPLPSPAP